jgi:hypothetical protein
MVIGLSWLLVGLWIGVIGGYFSHYFFARAYEHSALEERQP